MSTLLLSHGVRSEPDVHGRAALSRDDIGADKDAFCAKLGNGTDERLLPKADDAFKVMPPSIPEFNHYEPAAFLVANERSFAEVPGMSAALERFEELFKDVLRQLGMRSACAKRW